MKTNKPCFIIILIFTGMFLSGIDAFAQQTADQLYEKALYLEEAKGEMQQAIDLYKEIINQYPGNRQVMAKALLHAGFCYEKLGLKEAQQAYQRVINDYGDYGIYRIDVQTGAILPIVKGQVQHPVWSSDGKMILYVSEQTILAHDLETNEEKQLFKAVGKISPANLTISPDGRQLAFSLSGTAPETSLMVMPVAGGSPREILQLKDPESIRSGWKGSVEWIADGRQILFVKAQKDRKDELWQISAEGGKPRNLGITNQGIISQLRVHPDGKRVAFTNAKLGNDVWVIENFVPKAEAKK